MSTVIGVVAGLGAIALYGLIDLVTTGLLGHLVGFHPATTAADGSHAQSGIGRMWALPLVVAGGAFAAAALGRWLAPETGGHGTDAAIDAIHHNPKAIRSRVTVVKTVASALTIGSGGSGGTEGPAAQISAAFGSLVARVFRLTDDQARIAVGAGLAAGVGAIFRAPLGGTMLGVELPYRRDMAADMLVPSLIASVVAFTEFGLVYGFGPTLGHQTVAAVPIWSLPLFLVLGVLAGLAARGFCWAFYRTKAAFDRWARMPIVLRPAVGGLLVGTLGLAIPGVLGTSYGVIQMSMNQDALLNASLWLLLALPLAKIVGTALSVGSGGSGGVFGPGLVIGATLGAVFWRVLTLMGVPVGPPAVFVIAGMAACLGSAIHAPIGVTILAVEITGATTALLPIMAAVAAAVMIVGDVTLYRSQLDRRSVELRAKPAAVSTTMDDPISQPVTDHPRTSVRTVSSVRSLTEHTAHGGVVHRHRP